MFHNQVNQNMEIKTSVDDLFDLFDVQLFFDNSHYKESTVEKALGLPGSRYADIILTSTTMNLALTKVLKLHCVGVYVRRTRQGNKTECRLSGKASYRKISWGFEAARFGFRFFTLSITPKFGRPLGSNAVRGTIFTFVGNKWMWQNVAQMQVVSLNWWQLCLNCVESCQQCTAP